MNFEQFFDPYNIEHIKAYAHLEKTGQWPAGFVPADVVISYLDITIAQNKMAHALVEITLKSAEQRNKYFDEIIAYSKEISV